jgi:hypothetical protein
MLGRTRFAAWISTMRTSRSERRARARSVVLGLGLGLDAIEPVGDHVTRRAMKLGGQRGAGCPGADDRDVRLARDLKRRW